MPRRCTAIESVDRQSKLVDAPTPTLGWVRPWRLCAFAFAPAVAAAAVFCTPSGRGWVRDFLQPYCFVGFQQENVCAWTSWAYDARFYELVRDCSTKAPSPKLEEADGNLSMVHVAYVANAKYFSVLRGSIISLVTHLGAPERCTIHMVVPAEDMKQAKRFVKCLAGELGELRAVPAMRLHRMAADPPTGDDSMLKPARIYHSNPPTYTVFYLPYYFPELPRLLYLDADTTILADVAPLYRTHMTQALAAVPDSRMEWWSSLLIYFKAMSQSVRDRSAPVFNGGVLLLDLERWRQQGASPRLEAWKSKFPRGTGNQLPLNLEFQGRVDILDW